MRTRAAILRRRSAEPRVSWLVILFIGIVAILSIAFCVELLSLDYPVPKVPTLSDTQERDPLWDSDRMGKLLQRELDKVEGTK